MVKTRVDPYHPPPLWLPFGGGGLVLVALNILGHISSIPENAIFFAIFDLNLL